MKTTITAATICALTAGAHAGDFFGYGGGQVMTGQDPLGTDASQVGTKIDQKGVALGIGAVFHPDEPTGLGAKPQIFCTFLFNYYTLIDRTMMNGTKVDETLMPDAPMSFGWTTQGGTYVPFLGGEIDQLQAVFATEVRIGVDRQTADSFSLALSGGVRFAHQDDHTKIIAAYTIAPFWAGTDRLEHRFTAEATFGGFGVLAGYTRGQLRGVVDGFTANTFVLAAEVRK